MKVSMTYVGASGTNVWGGVHQLPVVEFEKNKPVEIDTTKVKRADRGFYEHMIAKARNNRFFKVEDLDDSKDVPNKIPDAKDGKSGPGSTSKAA